MFLATSWLHLIRGRVRSLKCVVRAPSCQTFWRVRLIAHRLPGLFVWYISNKLREAYHFSSSPLLLTIPVFPFLLSLSLFLFWKYNILHCLTKNIPNVAFTDYSGRIWNQTLRGRPNNISICIITLPRIRCKWEIVMALVFVSFAVTGKINIRITVEIFFSDLSLSLHFLPLSTKQSLL